VVSLQEETTKKVSKKIKDEKVVFKKDKLILKKNTGQKVEILVKRNSLNQNLDESYTPSEIEEENNPNILINMKNITYQKEGKIYLSKVNLNFSKSDVVYIDSDDQHALKHILYALFSECVKLPFESTCNKCMSCFYRKAV
jgi:hypothetical protein